MHNHTSARSFFVELSTDTSPDLLLEVGVDVRSNARTHEVRVEIPANSRQALAATLISAFRNLNQLIVHAGEDFFDFYRLAYGNRIPDSYEFKIKFSPHEVDVATASALIDSDGVLIIRVQRLRGWLYWVQARSLLSA
jgi:hypothetical protein